MGRHFARGMVVLADGEPGSEAPLHMSATYAELTIALAREGADIPGADEVVHPGRGGLTIDELFGAAVEAHVPWVAMRRDIDVPFGVLGQLLEATGRHASADLPGFAAILANGRGRQPIERILVVLDRVDGQPSGLMVLMAVAAAESTGARLDVLLIGAPGESVSTPRSAMDVLRASRDVDLMEQGLRRSADSGVTANWMVVEDVADRTGLVLDLLAEGDYDLLIDDLGAVKLGGRFRRGGRIEAALAPEGPGGIARAVLEQTDVPVAIVLDAVRLGVVPPGVVAGGAGAVLALGLIASGSPAATASPSARATVHASVTQTVDAYHDALDQAASLTAPTDVGSAAQTAQQSATETIEAIETIEQGADAGQLAEADAAAQAQPSAQAATLDSAAEIPAAAVSPAELAPEEVGPEKAAKVDADAVKVADDVDEGDVAKAEKKATATKADLKEARASFDEAQETTIASTAEVEAAAQAAAEAADGLAAAETAYEQAYAQTEATIDAASGLSGILRGGAAQEEIAAAEQAQADALASLDAARAEADDALERYQEAGIAAATDYEALHAAAGEVTQADAAHQKASAKAEATESTYEQAQANARVTPVPGYVVTTGHGVAGPMWSTGHHTGVDYAAPTGTDVVAAARGTVVEVSSGGAYGNRIVIQHDDGYRTTYNHLSSVDVHVGQSVDAGDHVGTVGSTGNSSGSHLHFEVSQGGDGWSGGSFVDPVDWLVANA